jgi:tRNA G10  N-methylase Trm11
MKNKKFDCVEMKKKSQEIIYNEIKNMSKSEELDFWQKGTADLHNLQRSSKIKSATSKIGIQRKIKRLRCR